MVHRGYAYIGHMFSGGSSASSTCATQVTRGPVNYIPAPPGTWNIHLQTHDDLLLVINAKDMFAAAEFADEHAYYSGQLGHIVGTARASARATGPPGWRSMISPNRKPRRIGFMPVEGGGIHRIWYTGGRWAYASVLLDGFTDYIFMTVDMSDPAKPARGGALLDSRNGPGGRRDAHWPAGQPLRPASRDRPRRYGVRRVARRRHWSLSMSPIARAKTDHAPELVAAVRRRHTQLPAPARPRSARRARRGRARSSGGRA